MSAVFLIITSKLFISFQTPGLRARSQRIEMVCKRYIDEKRVTELENLVKITKDVYGIDRNMMYTFLLSACIRTDDVARASGLWTQMQEEDVQANEEFLRQLGKFLQNKNQPVPFAIPDATEELVLPKPKAKVSPLSSGTDIRNLNNVVKAQVSETISPLKTKFLAALKNGNVDSALEIKSQ